MVVSLEMSYPLGGLPTRPHPWCSPLLALATLTRSAGHTRSPTYKWNSPVSSSDQPLDSAVHLMMPQAASPPSAGIEAGWLPRWTWIFMTQYRGRLKSHGDSENNSQLTQDLLGIESQVVSYLWCLGYTQPSTLRPLTHSPDLSSYQLIPFFHHLLIHA